MPPSKTQFVHVVYVLDLAYMQVHILKTAESDQNTSWWIKGDGVDMVSGLGESVRGQWSGDVDLNDGSLNSLYCKYKQQLKAAGGIGLRERGTPQVVVEDLNTALKSIDEGLTFQHSGKEQCTCTCMAHYLVSLSYIL